MVSTLLVDVAGAATGVEEPEEAPPSAEPRPPFDAAPADLSFVTEGVLVVKATEPEGAPAEERSPFVADDNEALPAR